MEVAIGSNGSRPFQREVREWQRIDPNTGALLTGRLEADRWINGSQNAYGKVVDSQNLSQPNGTQHTQRKQLEVLQARTSSGSLQVVRAQTVQTSSSRWSSSSSSTSTPSGSIGPKKQASQSIDSPPRFSIPLQQLTNGHHSMTNGHEDHFNHHSHQFMTEPSLKLSSLMKNTVVSNNSQRSSPHSPTINSAQRHRNDVIQQFAADRGGRNASDTDRESYSPERVCSERGILDAGHSNNLRRSVSNDDLTSIDWNKTDHESGGDSSEWRRVSKIRRSFQLPKSTSPKPNATRPLDLPENSVSVSRIRHELENGHRVSASMRSDHADLMALDTILNGSTETESLKEIRGKLKKLSDESLYKEDFITQNDIDRGKTYAVNTVPSRKEFATQKSVILEDSAAVQELREKPDSLHNTNSWENRIRHRDMNSTEWYSRRKSYGFEKMVPPSASMFRQESSTDSGIGRSGELVNWSPTESTPRGTVITFGDPTKTSITLMNSSPSHSNNYQNSYEPNGQVVEVKRHSIAVDESKYVRENTRITADSKTAVHVNGYYTREFDSTQSSVFDESGKRQKRRVEFCKTEVHFAAESGRVNIVETDGKPPPTNNFRRRRRGAGSNGGGPIGNAYLEAITSGKPVIHFGDDFKDQYDPNALTEENMNVTVITNGHGGDSGSGSSVMHYEEETESDEISIRSILKNKPVKPRPYHLGENIETSESLWGVRLRPVSNEAGVAPAVGDVEEVKREATFTSSNKSSVAERVRIVEERKDDSGYSTKINLKISNSPYSWEAPELPKSNVMKIELHSPAGTLERKVREDPTPIPKDVPVAKPRSTINSVKAIEQVEYPSKDIIREKPSEILKVSGSGKLKRPDSLKIESGGARKLKEHELLYFGVKSPNEEVSMKTTSSSTSTKILKETKQKRHSTSEIPNKNWQLSNDKPDLLLHSPVLLDVTPSATLEAKIEKNHVEIKKDPIVVVKQGPVYENLQKPSTYSRKRDAERDEMILKEMHKEAELALQAIGSGKSSKDHHRRSLHRRSKEQLETIDEKRTTKSSQVNSSARPSSDGHYRQCCSNRSSSISSTESLSRPRGSSQSKSTKTTTDQPSKRSSQSSKDSSSSRTHRSSPKDSSQRKTTPHNSSEELHNGHHHQRGNGHIEPPHRPRRGKSREKERIVVKVDENQRITRSTVKTELVKNDRKASSTDSTKGSQRSSKGEKIDRNGSTRSKVSSTRSSSDSRKMTRSSTIKPSTSSGAGAGAGVTATLSSAKRSSGDHKRK